VVIALVWTLEFLVSILMIEASLSRYPEWPAYRDRTWRLVPGIF
jgi:hypothetical protein